MSAKMSLSQELTWRGFVNQSTFTDITELDKTKRTFYWGCDPSAPSLQIGNLAAGMMARVFIEHGFKPVILIGGATGMVGDPKDNEERQLKSLDEIEHNKQAIAEQYQRIFEGLGFTLVDNYDWFKDIGYLQFLRDIGKHTSLSQMLDREFVKARVGNDKVGLSYAEFSYALIQAYDFLHLSRHHDVSLQLCGADQWGNSVAGVDLIRRLDGKEAHVFSAPLVVNKSTGVKFGKSEAGAVWLDPELTSPYQFYQFWLNLDDAGVGDYLKIYTRIEPDEFDELMAEFKKSPEQRTAQQYLAYEVTKLIHGEAKAESARNVTATLFGDTPVDQLLKEDITMLAAEIPATAAGNLIDALTNSGVITSNGEAKRMIEAGAISVNGQKVDSNQKLTVPSLIKKGKNTFILVK